MPNTQLRVRWASPVGCERHPYWKSIARLFDTGLMQEAHRVTWHAWIDVNEAGGRLHPLDEPLDFWRVTKIHAQYLVPGVRAGSVDEQGRELSRRTELRAYLVDLDGSEALNLPTLDRVLLYQTPPVGWWWIKQVDGAYLEAREPYRVEGFPQHGEMRQA